MNALIQYDFFTETTDEDVLKAEISALKESHNAVRKKAFAQIGALTKIVLDQQNEIDFLKVKMGLACSVNKPDALQEAISSPPQQEKKRKTTKEKRI